jgi:hypothetical protein
VIRAGSLARSELPLCDQGSTHDTRAARVAVGLRDEFAELAEQVLVAAVLQRRAACGNRALQNGPHTGDERTKLFPGEIARTHGRVNPCFEADLVRVDVSQAGHAPLIQEHRLDHRAVPSKLGGQCLHVQVWIERLRPQHPQTAQIRRDLQQAKGPRIGVDQLGAVREPQHAVNVSRQGRSAESSRCGLDAEPSAHSQVDEQVRAVRERKVELFADPSARQKGCPACSSRERSHIWPRDAVEPRPARRNGAAHDQRRHLAPDRLDLGKLGHASSVRDEAAGRRGLRTDRSVPPVIRCRQLKDLVP